MLSIFSQLGLENINIPAQIVMLAAFIVMASSFWCKDRKKILGLQIISGLLFVIQYILLGAKTGAILNTICIGRAYLFKFKDNSKPKRCKTFGEKLYNNIKRNAILYLFIIAFLVSSLIMWEGPKGIFALMATLVYTVGLWEDKPQNIRIGSNIAAFFWFSYNFSVGGYIGCITETIMFVSNMIAIVKHGDEKKKARKRKKNKNKSKKKHKKHKKHKENKKNDPNYNGEQEEIKKKRKYEGLSKKEIKAIKRKKQARKAKKRKRKH